LVASASAVAAGSVPSSVLLTIDQNRATVVDRIVGERGNAMLQSGTGITFDQLRAMLMQLRADQLLAASMAGTSDGVRDVIARSLVGADPINPALLQPVSSSSNGAGFTKAIGDQTDDVVYTPVTPCRLVETRGTFPAVYQGNGAPAHTADPFAANEIRTYTIQGGNSVCTAQLPSGLGAAAVQLQVFGIPIGGASGDIEILPQGSTFGSTATEVYIGSIAFNTVSTTAKINTTNNEISVQVRGGKANLAMDVVGYFRLPGNYENNVASGFRATVGGGIDNSATGQNSVVSGGGGNLASGNSSAVVGGFGNAASGEDSAVAGGSINTASGFLSVVLGGEENTASGILSIAAGSSAVADQTRCAVFDLWNTVTSMNCGALESVFRIGATTGFSIDYHSQLASGYGTKYVGIGDFVVGETIATWTGAFLSDGGTWTNNSDRDSKVQVASADSASILTKVASLPISTWRYKVEEGQVHLGPMAQDFHAAFGLGADEKHIATIDEDGVALAAIQALYARALEDEAQLRSKDEQIRMLSAGLSEVKEELAHLRDNRLP
jgi:Chaperone of endosialidase